MMYSRPGCEEIFRRISQKIHPDHLLARWWHDARPGAQGLRISTLTRDCLLEYGIEHYDFCVDIDLMKKPRMLLALDQKISCPYYIDTKKPSQLMLFGSKDAVMLSLYNDIERFLSNTLPKSN